MIMAWGVRDDLAPPWKTEVHRRAVVGGTDHPLEIMSQQPHRLLRYTEFGLADIDSKTV